MKKALLKLLPKIIGARINALSIWSKKAAAKKAFLIFCSPKGGGIKEHQRAELDAAKDQRIIIDKNNTIQTYRWKGSGPTILLIHGWESNSHRWLQLVTSLQEQDYNVIAFDAPAHGNSTGKILNVPLYSQAVQAVSEIVKPSVHIGHSIGGLTTIYHYHKYQPEHIKKLVILGAPAQLSVIMKDYQRLLGLKNTLMKGLDTLLQQRFGFSIDQFSGFSFAKAIPIPGLIIHDKHDQITPVASGRGIHENWTNSLYVETSGLGHSLYHSKVQEHILKFIK